MEIFYYLLYWQFLVMVIVVFLLNIFVSMLFPRIHFSFLLTASCLTGFFYTVLIQVKDLLLFSMLANGVFALIGMGYVKYFLFLKRKAEELKNQ